MFESFERDLRLATKGLRPEEINKALAAFAKQELRRVIASGQASPTYDRYVNGVKGAIEESVRAPGPILYEFINWPLVIRAALEELRNRSPRRSGRYAAGFVVLANGVLARDYSKIPAEATVTIFNVRPYTRRLETGKNRAKGKRHFESSKQAVARRFREGFSFQVRYLKIPSGIHPEVPYRLKGGQGRKGRLAGDTISYPSLVINLVR
jgi:hypothetical protein